ncbi:hypothetical protein Bpfe_006009 [Biomphalaria pfeifferi]|uniref:Uncharacterized protein n=1 Tax=Biomphalaria pfeifferi TaxID=112525 RepID=A0AAD8C2N5_BIOPF|nr:hypothetical protein Bpfe_006009 [Biomphalaria pfeifferi]
MADEVDFIVARPFVSEHFSDKLNKFSISQSKKIHSSVLKQNYNEAVEHSSKEKEDFMKVLNKFQKANEQEECEETLTAIFNCASKDVNFNPKEQKQIGKTMKTKLEDLFEFLYELASNYDFTRERVNLLHIRSALQIILDDFSKYPTDVEGETLQSAINAIVSVGDDTVSELDSAVEHWKRYVVSESQVFSVKHLKKPEAIPCSHTWWR